MAIDFKHASAHALGGADELTLDASQITGLPSSVSLSTANTWTATQTFKPTSTATTGLILKMLSGQTADALQVQDSSGSPFLMFAGKPLTVNGDFGFLVTPTVSTSAPAAVYCYQVAPTITNNDSGSAVIGSQVMMNLGSGGAPTFMIGQQIYMNSVGGTAISNVEGLDLGSAVLNAGSYISYLKDIVIKDVYCGTGNYCGTHYGIFMQDMVTAGTNYAIWTGLGMVHLGGDVEVSGVFSPMQAPTASAPAYVKGGMYFDTTLNKLRIGGATAWETVTSV